MIHFINWKYHKMWEIQNKAVNKYMTMILSKLSIVQFSSVTQSCPTLCDPMDCSLPGSSVHGVFQTRVLEWVGISFSRGSSQHRDRSRVSLIAGRQFTIWAIRETKKLSASQIQRWDWYKISMCIPEGRKWNE